MRMLIADIGKMDYDEALALQERVLALRQKGLIDDTLLLVEHPPVLTIGRSGTEEHILLPKAQLLELGVKAHEISRGGDVTYHGPGQIVGYPILDLHGHGKDIKQYIWNIEEVFIKLMDKEFSIEAVRESNKYTGVWVGDTKVVAIGVAVRRWVTMHGFAFNANTNLDHFKWIVPCGISDRGVASVQSLLGHAVDFELLKEIVGKEFCEVFNAQAIKITKDDLVELIEEIEKEVLVYE